MENVVPSVLQRLRASDIIRMAGLAIASLGQEYFRQGAVHHTHRQGARLSGIVDVLHAGEVPAASAAHAAEKTFAAHGYSSHYPVEVELHTSTSWTSTCPCDSHSATLCMHAAALLYQWLARPSTFSVSPLDTQDAMLENTPYSSNQADNNSDDNTSVSSPVSPIFPIPQPSQSSLSHPVLTPLLAESEQVNGVEGGSSRIASLPTAIGTDATRLLEEQEQAAGTRMMRPLNAKPLALTRGPAPLASLQEILTQMGLSELRSIAREYAMAVNTSGKQQLVDSILEILKQTDTVRRMANTLEKPPRQLLAALTLAGGSMSDDDLRGVYERFGLGQPGQLQNTLAALQNKGFLFRASLNSAPQQRIGMSGALLDVGWFVPTEVRNALRVTVPVATLDVERANENGEAYDIRMATPYTLLADLLLVARSLDGFNLDREQEREKEKPGNIGNTGATGAANATSPSRSTSLTTRHPTGQLAPDGSIPLPAPVDMPSATLLATVQKEIDRPQPLLRFATRLIRLADIVHKDDGGTPHLRVLPHVAQLLLGSVHAEVTRDLFELWLTQSPYDDLFDLRNDGLRLRCRATSLSHPMLRISELEAENAEARQAVIALLAQTPFQQWISFSSFARFVYRLNPLFLQKRQRLFSMPHWWIEYEEGRPLRPTQLNDWLRAEYYYLAHLIRGPLHWWGICDIAYARDGRLAAFRLTPLARWLLHGDVEPALREDDTLAQVADNPYDIHTTEGSTIMVTAQDELLVPCTAQAWPLIYLLDRFAQTAGVQNGRLCYRLTPAALGAALSNGTSPEPLLAALQQLSVQNKDGGDDAGGADDGDAQERQSALALTRIIAQLQRWIASYGRIRLYTGVALVEVAEAVVMRELQATTSLEEHILHSVQPTLHILKKVGAERLVDELKRRSQTPLLHGEEEYGAE